MANVSSTLKDYEGNLGDFEVFRFKVVETHAPNSPWAQMMKKEGTQNTSSLSRGNMNDSIHNIMNANLSHACDFKFIFNLNFSSLGLINPVEAIQKALRNSKLKAANRMRTLMKEAAQLIRKGIDALLKVMGMDPSGQLSLSFQIGKDLVRKINDMVEWIAEKVEEVMEWVFFYQEVQKLIEWIKSLPEKLKQLLQTCLANFTAAVNNILQTIKNLPNQITSQVQGEIAKFASQIAQAAAQTEAAARDALTSELQTQSGTMPDTVYAAVISSNTSTSVELVQAHIDETTANSNSQIANTVSDISTASSPSSWA